MKNSEKKSAKKSEKKIVVPEKVALPQETTNRWSQHRNTFVVVGLVAVLVFSMSALYMKNLKERSIQSWGILGEVWNTLITGHTMSQELEVKDLSPDLQTLVKECLGDVHALPERVVQEKKLKDLDSLSVEELPNPLKAQVMRAQNIKLLEAQMKTSQRTSAGPWLAYSLAHLYFLDQRPQEALQCYDLISNEYSNHPLHQNLAQLQEWNTVKEEVNWLSRAENKEKKAEAKVEAKKKIAAFTTSAGKFEVELFEQDCPLNTAQFIALAQKGTFNGINFYRISEYAAQSGCLLGNGKGNIVPKTKADLKDVMMQRGLLIMDNGEREDEIDSRFLILKKYPEGTAGKRYAFVGKVLEPGMQVVAALTSSDVLLDVTIK